jgi:hypothetical protein
MTYAIPYIKILSLFSLGYDKLDVDVLIDVKIDSDVSIYRHGRFEDSSRN